MPNSFSTKFLALLLGLVLAFPLSAANADALPGFARVKDAWHSSDIRILDRHGEPLQEIRGDPSIRRTDWVGLHDISPALIAAVLRAEDHRFFEHAGVDWLAAAKAALTNWLNDKPRGASTITMQLVALLDPRYRAQGRRRDVPEKLRQMEAARELERTWSKSQILEAYFNLLPLRGELTGIDAASRGLFDKRPAGLDEGEALILAALIRSPNAKARDVSRRVCALASHTKGAPGCAKLRALTLATLTGRYPILPSVNLAPHLAQRLLAGNGGKGTGPDNIIRTSLDADLQRFVHSALSEQLRRLADRNVQDAAALVVENASGRVLAYVSQSGAGSESPQSDGVQAPRQAGSTLKPFLYGLALDRHLLTAASPLMDAPLNIATPGGQYTPQDYDNTYRGLVSMRSALASSLNIPAVNTLQLVGLEPFANRLAQLGFSGLTEAADYYGYSLALGSLDVRLWELVNAYRTLANGGRFTPLSLKPDANPGPGQHLYSREAAWLVGDILSDRQARAITFGLENPLATRYWTAVKTGTSKDMRDNWCVGFSERYTVGVWAGNFDGTPMHDVSGISGAAPAWQLIMDRLQAGLPSNEPAPPPGLHHRLFQPPGEPLRGEWFLAGTEPPQTAWDLAHPPAEITHPGDGEILAMDPDIPPDRQRLDFQARDMPADAHWVLDNVRRDSGEWPLSPGHHTLILRTDAAILDQVEFEVR